MVVKALILEVGDNMVRECERFCCLVEKVVDLKDEVVTQKAEIEVLRSRRKEDTPAMGIIVGLNTLVTRKKKSLEYLKRLSDGKDPSYEFWQRVIRYKIIVDEYKMLIAAE